MHRINYLDLQIGLEKFYWKEVSIVLESLRLKYDFIKIHNIKREKNFYDLIGASINVDKHYAVEYIINRVKNNLKIDIEVKMMLYQSTLFNIVCFPRNQEGRHELVVFVSQHYFNNLSEDEQVAILGHEIAHLLFRHLDVPIHEVLNFSFELSEIDGLKSNLLNWSKACEITSDMIGLVSNDFNFKGYSTAIIKHFTGLNDSSHSKFNISPVVELVIQQYEQLASDPIFTGEVSTHPLTQLRVKIINSITKTRLIKNYGESVSVKKYNEFKYEFDETINELIKGIYPEMLPGISLDEDIQVPMALAVALSDGNVDEKEIKAIDRIIRSNDSSRTYRKVLMENKKLHSFEDIVSEFINKSCEVAKRKNVTQQDLVPIFRNLLVIAASDGEIEKSELETIYRFAKNFGFKKEDIVIILQKHNTLLF